MSDNPTTKWWAPSTAGIFDEPTDTLLSYYHKMHYLANLIDPPILVVFMQSAGIHNPSTRLHHTQCVLEQPRSPSVASPSDQTQNMDNALKKKKIN